MRLVQGWAGVRLRVRLLTQVLLSGFVLLAVGSERGNLVAFYWGTMGTSLRG